MGRTAKIPRRELRRRRRASAPGGRRNVAAGYADAGGSGQAVRLVRNCFGIKYDAVRTLAAMDELGWRLWGRERADYTTRYPELDVLRRLPAGTLVDGELVAFDADGRPNLRRLLSRHGLTDPWRIRQARQWCPVRYVLFDLLYHGGRCLVREPLVRRRGVLVGVGPRRGVLGGFLPAGVGAGTALFSTAFGCVHG